MKLKKILKEKTLPLVLSVLIGAGAYGCAGLEVRKRVKEISSQTMASQYVYPEKIDKLFSNIEGVLGKKFVDELKQIPEMRSDYTPEKINALQDIYSVGEKIQNKDLTNAKSAIEDIVEAGADTPTTNLISVPLREWYLMHLNEKWDVKDSVEALNKYNKKNPLWSLLQTDWKDFNNKDWKKWEKMGKEYVVLYKKNLDYLIQYNQAKRLRYYCDKRAYAQTPEETRKKGRGDCKDFAIEAGCDMEVLAKTKKYNSVKVANFCNQEYTKGHAFLIYRKEGEKGVFVMDNARRTGIRKFNSTSEAGKKIAKEVGYKAGYMWAYPWRAWIGRKRNSNFFKSESLL